MTGDPWCVGLGELRVSNDPTTVMTTIGLGSCVAVVAVAPAARVVGMAHIVLPQRRYQHDTPRAIAYFADAGVPALLAQMRRLGCGPDLVIKLVGGASLGPLATSSASTGSYQIGKRNIEAVRHVLASHRLIPRAEDVGGTIPRTARICVGDGKLTVTSPNRAQLEL